MRQRRWIITRVIVFLLLGAIVNVAVAWGFNLMPYSSAGTRQSYLPDEKDVRWWRANAPDGFATEPAGVDETRLFGRRSFFIFEITAGINGNTIGNNCGRFQTGWPCLSMEGATWVNRKTRTAVQQDRVIVPTAWPFAGRWVSLGLIWPGFAINTLFYAGILWLLFAVPYALRRRRRIKRGLCPACAYPVGESEVCTECGAAVDMRSTS